VTDDEATDIDRFTTEIYQVALELTPLDFVEWCFDRLPELVPSRALSWAYLMSDGSIDSAYIRGVDNERAILEEYEIVREFDKLTPHAMRHQNTAWSANALDPANQFDESYKNFVRKYDVPKAMVFVSSIPPTANLQVIALWRGEADAEFCDSDEAKLERCSTHLVQGLIHSRQYSIRRRLLANWSRHNHVATVTRHGLVVDIEEGFNDIVRQHWPEHGETQLPPTLLAMVDPEPSHHTTLRVGDVLFRLHRHEAIELFIATELGELAKLTDRELEISRMFAGGADHRQIAESIQRSSATVRNHLRNVYQKLNVSTRTQLATVLDRLTPFVD